MPPRKHSILPQAETFLQEAMDIPILSIKEEIFDNYSFLTKDYNSTITITADSIKLTVVACYDTRLIDKIVKNFMEIDNIIESEKEELYLDASGEIINIIIGLASPKYIEKGMTTQMSTPLVVTTVDDISLDENHSVLSEKIHTFFGDMTLSIISSQILTGKKAEIKTEIKTEKEKEKEMTVLVADDSLMIRKKMQSMIEKLGHNVILASNGEEAIEIYKDKKPDIVTMDLSMPIMDGFEALKHLIKIDPYAKVIMSTANSFSDLVLSAMKEGASGYILKPIKADILEDAINQAINDIAIESKKNENDLLKDLE